MLKTLYIHNYKCFQNFTLDTGNMYSLLIIGKNGVGKSGIMEVLHILQSIGRGEHRVENLIDRGDISVTSRESIITFKIDVEIDSSRFDYTLSLEFPNAFSKFRVEKELLNVNGDEILNRSRGTSSLNHKAQLNIDWHYIALPLIFDNYENKDVIKFRNWLADMIIISPIPSSMTGISTEETDYLHPDCKNFVDFLTSQMNKDFSLFGSIREKVRYIMKDFAAIKTASIGESAKHVDIAFDSLEKTIPFDRLSDGEKIFILEACLMALASQKKDFFLFWDEPDNYLAHREIQAFTRDMRSYFIDKNNLIITSHSKELANSFSYENTLLMTREAHSTPCKIKNIQDDMNFDDIVEFMED